MEIFNKYTKGVIDLTLILGFFDGMHVGHRSLINSAVDFGRKNLSKTALLTFKKSPAEFFCQKSAEYIFDSKDNYKIAESLGVDYIFSLDFSELANIEAEDYIKNLVAIFSPKAVFSGFNHTFGKGKRGDSSLLNLYSNKFGYKYYCIEPKKINGEIVSSTKIKAFIKEGDFLQANTMLGSKFFIKSKVVHGLELGNKLGYPTANMIFPEQIVKPPYGVYKVEVLNRPAILNWGVKPTVGNNSELLEVHIPNFEGNLYGQELKVEFTEKIRNEKKFANLNELKAQINEDIKECLK